jgi:hypothetical protein
MKIHIQNTIKVYRNFTLIPTIIIDLDYKSIIFTWLSVAVLIEKT